MSTIAEIKALTAYSLAGMADCAGPDDTTSVGAELLTSVRDETIEAVQFANDDIDTSLEPIRSDG